MAIPDYQSLMLPVLRSAADGEVRIGDVIEKLADELNLSDEERSELNPSKRQTVFANQVHWARTYLLKAQLIEATRRAHFKITERGRRVLAENPDHIDNEYLTQFPEFVAFRNRVPGDRQVLSSEIKEEPASDRTPDEIMRSAYTEIEQALRRELLDRVIVAPPDFFEKLVVNLIVAMGYGGSLEDSGRTLGRSGDGGVAHTGHCPQRYRRNVTCSLNSATK